MRQNLRAGNRVTILDRFRSACIVGIMLAPTRLKVPGAVNSIMPLGTPKDLSALRKEWAADRQTLTSFLESLSGTEQQLGVFRHPFGGWTTPNGALLFLRSHLRHHLYQLARLRRITGAAFTIERLFPSWTVTGSSPAARLQRSLEAARPCSPIMTQAVEVKQLDPPKQ